LSWWTDGPDQQWGHCIRGGVLYADWVEAVLKVIVVDHGQTRCARVGFPGH